MKLVLLIGFLTMLSLATICVAIIVTEDRQHQIVSIDIAKMTKEFTIELAAKNVSQEQMKTQIHTWSHALQAELLHFATEHRFIIFPTGLGIVGIKDITHIFENEMAL